MTDYVGLPTGKVVHIKKPNSYFNNMPNMLPGFTLTLCGRRVRADWFQAGIMPYGKKKPDYMSVCKQCAARDTGAVTPSSL